MSIELKTQASREASFLGFLSRQLTNPKPIPANTDLGDQVAIVTGSNVGLGLEASRQLLQFGLSRLIMAVRSQVKGDAAADQLRAEFPVSTISVWLLDMESYESIRAFARQCEGLSRLDIAILNAGLIETRYTVAPATKHEMMLQVNYLSTALLSILLLPILKSKRVQDATRPPVLTIVGSDLAYRADVKTTGPVLQQLDTPKGFSGFTAYSKSKLLLMLFISKLAEVVKPDDVLINMVNPGMTSGTAFFRGFPTVMVNIIALCQWLIARPLRVAASTYVDAAVAQGVESHGAFTSEWTIKPYAEICYTGEGRKVRERLWVETMEELSSAGVQMFTNSWKI